MMKGFVLLVFAVVLVGACGGGARGSYSDPFAYCGAVGNQDDPSTDARWTGVPYPDAVVDGLGTIIDFLGTREELAQQTLWRCMDGQVRTCYLGTNIPCGPADTATEPSEAISQYCQEHPQAPVPASVTGHATIYRWECRAGAAVIARTPLSADARGYVAEFWYLIEE